MRSLLTRRSFMKRTSAKLGAAAFAVSGTRSLYASVVPRSNKLALLGGTPVRTKPFDSTWPVFDEKEEKALLKALRSRNWCCLRGRAVYDFEKEFAEALRTEGIPAWGGERRYARGCHKEGMLEEHLNSRAFQASFSKARLKKYRESLQLPIIDKVGPTGREKLSIEGKTTFLGPKGNMDEMIEAFAKVAKNSAKLT